MPKSTQHNIKKIDFLFYFKQITYNIKISSYPPKIHFLKSGKSFLTGYRFLFLLQYFQAV